MRLRPIVPPDGDLVGMVLWLALVLVFPFLIMERLGFMDDFLPIWLITFAFVAGSLLLYGLVTFVLWSRREKCPQCWGTRFNGGSVNRKRWRHCLACGKQWVEG